MSFDWFSFNVRLNVPSMHNYAQDASVNDYAFEAWERMTYGGVQVGRPWIQPMPCGRRRGGWYSYGNDRARQCY